MTTIQQQMTELHKQLSSGFNAFCKELLVNDGIAFSSTELNHRPYILRNGTTVRFENTRIRKITAVALIYYCWILLPLLTVTEKDENILKKRRLRRHQRSILQPLLIAPL